MHNRGKPSGNIQFAQDVSGWTFQENNALRVDKVEHHRVNETEPQETYTINDVVVCSSLLCRLCNTLTFVDLGLHVARL